MRLGFLGLGAMGIPMVRNLARHFPITVWNRSPNKYLFLKDTTAAIGKTPAQVARDSDIIFVMLFNAPAIHSILTDKFKLALRGKTLINTSSVPVEFSEYLAATVQQSGGRFVEMPVSGSKVPAEQAQLVGLLAGDRELTEQVRPYVAPLTRAAIYCGPIGSGLKAKYAINTLLITYTVGLSESMNLARAQGLDMAAFGQVLDACPMASPYSKIKVQKVLNNDWTPQAALQDSHNSAQLIEEAIEKANTRSPSMQVCSKIIAEAMEAGFGEEDMISVAKVVGKSNL